MTTALYNTDEKKGEFRANVTELVTDGFGIKQAIFTQATIDLFLNRLFEHAEMFIDENGNIDFTNIRRLAKITVVNINQVTATI